MDDQDHPGRKDSGETEDRDSPMWVQQDNESSSPNTSPDSEGQQRPASPRASQSPEGPAMNPDEAPDPGAPAGANNDQANDTEANAGDQSQEQANAHHVPGGYGNTHATCLRKRRQLQMQVDAANATIEKLKQLLRALGYNPNKPSHSPGNANALRRARRCNKRTVRSKVYTWREPLRRYIARVPGVSYRMVWELSQRELNMPIKLESIHPNIRLIERDGDESLDGNSRQASPVVPPASRPQRDFRFSFDDLPREALYMILEHLLSFDGCLVHCFSRLDPYKAPDHLPSEVELGQTRTGIKGRFFISAAKRALLSLTYDTIDPNELLAPLSVCRSWAWYGANIFYGHNTFAFSSLGEWGRFCNGIKTRIHRLQNVELNWIGNPLCLLPRETEAPGKSHLNMRTRPLRKFCETSRLKTLVIHLSETSNDYIRRRYEPAKTKLYMKDKTAGQPNARLTRALRNLHGVDYIYQLRGLYWVHVYNMDKANADMTRQPVRDRSFELDLERVVTQQKVPSRAAESQLRRLKPLFPRGFPRGAWDPSPDDFKLIDRMVFNEDTGHEDRVNDLDFDDTSSRGTTSGNESSDGSDSDSESEDSDSDSDGPEPGGAGTEEDTESEGSDSEGSDSDESGPDSRAPSPAPSDRHAFRDMTPVEIPYPDQETEADDTDAEGEQDSDHDNEDDSQQLSDDEDNQPHSEPEGDAVDHTSGDIRRPEASSMENPITIEDDDDDVQGIPAPDWRRSTQTPGMFMTPNPWEQRVNTSSRGRNTNDLTAEPDGGGRRDTTVDSGGLLVRQSNSAARESLTPGHRTSSAVPYIDLTLSDDEENDEHMQDYDLASYKQEAVSGDERATHTPTPTPTPSEQDRGMKRPASVLTTASAPDEGEGYKRQKTDDRAVSYDL